MIIIIMKIIYDNLLLWKIFFKLSVHAPQPPGLLSIFAMLQFIALEQEPGCFYKYPLQFAQ